jgi:hypothetical protein
LGDGLVGVVGDLGRKRHIKHPLDGALVKMS